MQTNSACMKWIRLTKPVAAVQVYNLVQSKIIKETLRYHPQQQSARLNCNGQQRLFFIEPQGFRTTHFVIKNEYGFHEAGIHIGYTSLKEESGIIEYEQQKIQFTFFHDKLVSELVIYKQDGLKPIAVCELQLDMDEKEIPLFTNKSFHGLYASLIWSLYWWLITDRDRVATEIFSKAVPVAANSADLVH
jgi:hypothetical protein